MCIFVDCNIATERRKDPGKPPPRDRRERERDRLRRHRSRSPVSRFPPDLEYEARLRHMERLRQLDRDPYHDPYIDPYARAMRDPYARAREDPYERYRDRMAYPPWDYYGSRDPYERERERDMYYGRMGPPGREGYEGPPPPRGRESPPPVRGRGSPPLGPPATGGSGAGGGGEKPVDMEIIVVNKQQK